MSLRNFPSSSRFPVNGFGSLSFTNLSMVLVSFSFPLLSFLSSKGLLICASAIVMVFSLSIPSSHLKSHSVGSDNSGAVSKLFVSVVGSVESKSSTLSDLGSGVGDLHESSASKGRYSNLLNSVGSNPTRLLVSGFSS